MRCLMHVNGELVGVTRGESLADAQADALAVLGAELTPTPEEVADKVMARCGVLEVPPCPCGIRHGEADAGDRESGEDDYRDDARRHYEARMDDQDGSEQHHQGGEE